MIRTLLLTITAGLILSGCSQGGVASQSNTNGAALPNADALASRAASGGSLYVANDGVTDVTVYGLDGSGPSQTIKNGLKLGLRAIAVDSTSNVYVAMGARRGSAGAVNEYAHGTSKIVRKIRVVRPVALTVDGADNLYVLGLKGVEVFAPGSSNPSQTITNGIKNPTAMILDKSGNIYVGNGENGNSITVYSPSGTLIQTITDGVYEPTSLALDKAGRIYSLNAGANTVTVYYLKKGTVWKSFGAPATGGPYCLALDPDQNVYVATGDYNSVEVFSAAPNFALIRTIKTGLNAPGSLAFDGQGNLWVANVGENDVVKYLPGSTTIDATISNGIYTPIEIAIK